MSWISFAVFGYLLQSFSVLGDKLILRKVLPRPSAYAFWQGILSIGIVVFIPFGFNFLSSEKIFISFLSGAFSLYGLLFLFTALARADASNVLPVVLGGTALMVFFFERIILGYDFTIIDVLAGILLVAGSITLSLEHRWGQGKREQRFLGPAVVTAILFSFSILLIKYLFAEENFFSVLIWSRGGLLLAGLSLLLVPEFRLEIFRNSRALKRPRSTTVVVLNKLIGAVGNIFIYFAISRGPAALVNALQGLQYVFLFVLAYIFSLWVPSLIKESIAPKAIMQKIFGIFMVSAGLFILYFYGA